LKVIDDFENIEDQTGSNDVRLQVFLSRAGACSRRGAAEILKEGRVTVNGMVIREVGFRIKPEDKVLFDGSPVGAVVSHVYLALNKPTGYVCSSEDPEGRALAMDLLTSYEDRRLFSVGRLDFLSKGLIFFTNDGNFANTVSHPRNGFEKEYFVECKKEISKEFLEEFKKGIWAEGERYTIESYKVLGSTTVNLILKEGKNREIRNAFAARSLTIKQLKRIRIGCVQLGTLPEGRYRKLEDHEIRWFMSRPEKETHGRSH